MPVHDWTRIPAGILHDFHNSWLTHISEALNGGLLPKDFYSLMEQHAGKQIPDVLALNVRRPDETLSFEGGVAVMMSPPKVSRKRTLASLRRTLTIRHVSGHRMVAILEIVSPANKDRESSVDHFVGKIESVLSQGIHVLMVDIFPPARHDPQGMHGAIQQMLSPYDEQYDLPPDAPLTLASYAAGPPVEAFIEHVAPGADLPDMPLFLDRDHYIYVPLETTYRAAFRAFPAFWRDVVEGKTEPLPQSS